MKSKFLQVANVRALATAMSGLRTRDPGVPGLALVYGDAGRGKTETAIWYSATKDARYVVANPAWTPRWMLCEVAAKLMGRRKASYHSTQRAFEACCEEMERDPRPLIVDEADFLARGYKLLEMLRALHDQTGAPIVFVGTEAICTQMAEKQQFWSRVSETVPFAPLTPAEVGMVARELFGLELDSSTAGELQGVTRGLFRDVIVACSHLKRAAKGSGGQVEQPMIEAAHKRLRKVA